MAISIIESVDKFKELVTEIKSIEGYKEPIGFGIARVDRGQKNSEKILQASYAVANWKENFGSANIFIKALIESNIKVDFNSSEFVATINDDFIANALNAFAPFLDEAVGEAHKNVQVIKTLARMKDIGRDFRVAFIFEDTNPKSVESVYLKLYALSLS